MVAFNRNDSSKQTLAKMAMNRRRMLALGGLAAGAGALSACGGNTGRGSSEGVNLSQWYHQYGEAGTQQAAEKYAAAYKDATVTINWIPGDYDTALSSGLLAEKEGDYPDVFEGHLNRAMVESEQIVPLDDIFADVKDDFTEIDVKRNSIDGKIYGIQMIDDPQFLYYRPSLLEAAGITAPIATFEDLMAAAAELTTGDVKGLFLGNDDSATKLFQPIVFSAGQTLLTDDGQIGFTKDAVLPGIQQVKDLHGTDSLLVGAPTEAWDPSSIIQNLCAIQWCGLWALPQIIEAHGDDIAVMPVPGFNGGTPTVYNGGWSTFINAKSAHVEEAKAFAKWLWIDNTEYIQDWCLSYGFHIPPRLSMRETADALTEGPAADAVQISQDHGWGDDPNWTPKMETAIDDMMNHIVLEGADPDAEFDTAVATIQGELDSIFG